MMVYLETVRVSVLAFPFLFLILLVPLFLLHRRWYGELHEYRAGIFAIFAFYGTAAALMTVLPLPEDNAEFCARRAGQARAQMMPFASFMDVITYAERRGLGFALGDLLRNLSLWQIILNTALLAPLGFFLRALYGVGLGRTVLIGFGVSLFLELTQLTGVWGLAQCPYRLFDMDDLLTNTIGAGLGWFALRAFFIFPDPKAPEADMWYKKK